MLLLGTFAGTDPKVRQIIEVATRDLSFSVRHNPQIARWKVTARLTDYVRYLDSGPQGTEAQAPTSKRGSTRARPDAPNLILIDSSIQLMEWSERRPEELGTTLLQMLEDCTTPIRRGAVRLIGGAYVKVVLSKPDHPGEPSSGIDAVLPRLPRETKKEKPVAEKSRMGMFLDRQGIEKGLWKIEARDPEPTVREAARDAL